MYIRDANSWKFGLRWVSQMSGIGAFAAIIILTLLLFSGSITARQDAPQSKANSNQTIAGRKAATRKSSATVKKRHHLRQSHALSAKNRRVKRLRALRAAQRHRNARRINRRAQSGATLEPRSSIESRRDMKEREPLDASPKTPRTEGDFEGDQDARNDWFMFQRMYPFKEIDSSARRRAWEEVRSRADLRAPDAVGTTWASIGPVPTTSAFPDNGGFTSGRINSIAVSPANRQLVLVGSATGGIWRSIDGGTNFVPVSDNQVDLAVGSIAFSVSSPNVVYAAMGDLDNRYFGTGILKSTDAGVTWVRINNNTFPDRGQATKVAVDPVDPNKIYVAVFSTLNTTGGSNPVGGIFVSTDGGVSWANRLTSQASDLALHPTNPQIVYAAVRFGFNPTPSQGVYKSTDGGATWNKVYDSPYSNVFSSTRELQIAVTPARPNRVFVYVGTSEVGGGEARLEVSDDSGATWTTRGAISKGDGGLDTGQLGYNSYLAASPVNPNTVYIGSRDVFRSTDAGVTFADISNSWVQPWANAGYMPFSQKFHSDQQALIFEPGSDSTFYCGNDGGLFKTTDGGANFLSLNASLSLTQFTSLAMDPADPTRSYGGTQDNGTQRRLAGTSGWKEEVPISGDGGRVVINPLDTTMIFASYIQGSITRMTASGATFSGPISSGAILGSDPVAFYPPIIGNGLDARLYVGTNRLWICADCNDLAKVLPANPPTWTAPGGAFDQTNGGGDTLSTLAVSRSNNQIIYSGSRQGRAMASTNGGATWIDITTGLPNRSITNISVSPTDPALAYLTVSGFGTGHVFRSANSGAVWTDISGNLPNIPTSAFLIDPLTPATLYAGTDIGVFRSTDTGASWTAFNNGIPPVVIMAFTAQANGRIQVGTYGRGAYDLPTTDAPAAPAVGIAGATGSSRRIGPDANAPSNNTLDFVVTRTGNLNQTSTVHYETVDGSATAGGHDYEPVSGTLTFAAGETTKDVLVLIDSDDGIEPDEEFSVHLSAPVSAVITRSDGAGIIAHHNVAPTTFVGFSAAAYTGNESQSAAIVITRSGDTAGSSGVTFSTITGGTATGGAACGAGANYQTVTNQTVTFPQRSTTQTVSIPLCGNNQTETTGKTINLALTNSGGAALAAQTASVVTINDTANQFRSAAGIDMNLGGAASVYPAQVTVAGVPTTAFRIRVSLFDVSQNLPDNIKMLLVSPSGAKYVLMADAGGTTPIGSGSPVTLTFSDSVGAVLPDSTVLTTGKFLPTSWSTPIANFPAPAPSGPYAEPGSGLIRTTAQTFDGTFGSANPNGVWSLYVRDDNGGPIVQENSRNAPGVSVGSVASGWGIEILATAVTISGRVTTPSGQGLRNASVRLTDSQGVQRFATTSSFGFYTFDGVLPATYTIGVLSRQYRYASRTVSVTDNLTNVDFIGLE